MLTQKGTMGCEGIEVSLAEGQLYAGWRWLIPNVFFIVVDVVFF
jgi:hypothetical protein